MVVSTWDLLLLARFRWVHCQLDTLKRCTTREELREALDNLPSELEATYERILGAVDERKSEGGLVRRALALLMVAIEPLQLAQIIDGLSMDFQKRKNDHKTRQWLQTTLVHALSSLVSYHEETDVLTLSHFTVKVCLGIYLHYKIPMALRRNISLAVRRCRCIKSSLMKPTTRLHDCACAIFPLF